MTQLPRCYYAITKGVATKRVAIKAATKIKPVLCNTLFSHVYIFVFWNDYEISSDTVFLSFILKNIVLIIKHSGKVNFYFFIELCTFHLSSSAKLKIHFSWKENLKKCSSFEEQKVQGVFEGTFILTLSFSAVFHLQNVVSNLLKFVSLGRKSAFIRFHEEMRLISRTWCTFPQKSRLTF